MELFKATEQWSTRPADERFESLEHMHAACDHYMREAAHATVPWSKIRVEKGDDNDILLMGRSGIPARFSNWAFGQLCQKIGAPASYLRELPPTLACSNLNYGLAQKSAQASENGAADLMFHQNGGLLLRSVLTEKYERIWNAEVCERLVDMKARGWEPARPDKRFDGGDPTVCQVCDGGDSECMFCKGTGRALPALYASDHDMFAFLRNRNLTVAEKGTSEAIYKGVIVENSEVGASALKLTRFLYREMCGNHIIWGASNVLEMSIRHVGDARKRWEGYTAQIRKYAEESVNDIEARIAWAKECRIPGATKEDVLDAVFGKRINGLSRKAIEEGYEACKPSQDGDPNTVWGLVQGITRYSQKTAFADTRAALDRAAGKLLEINF